MTVKKYPSDNLQPESRAWAIAVTQEVQALRAELNQLKSASIQGRVANLESFINTITDLTDRINGIPNIVVSPTRPDTTDLPVPTVWIKF